MKFLIVSSREYYFRPQITEITNEVKEMRFSKGKVCPHCNCEDISRNGKYNNKQRYLCKDCGKTFTDFTNSVTYKSKKPLDKWMKYAKCMLSGYSIRKCAEKHSNKFLLET